MGGGLAQGSLWRRYNGNAEAPTLLHAWSLPLPADWLTQVQQSQTAAELEALRCSVVRTSPFDTEARQVRTARRQ